jgi:type II secretory ATPase GspE/PulE/Tfp pilus assembly ATPase PilB-like protein
MQKAAADLEMKCPEKSPEGKEIVYLYKGKGCDRCGGEGYSGRIGIFEVLAVDSQIEHMMLQDSPTSAIHKEAVKNGMITMKQDGFLKAIEGITTLEEVLRVTRD